MYYKGKGVYNDISGSFHNVSPVFNPESNGRAAFQVPTQHVPIYNPSLSIEEMRLQAEVSRGSLQTSGIINYATNSLNAENYSLLDSQARAKRYSNIMGGLGTIGQGASTIAGLLTGSVIGAPLGAAIMAGTYGFNKIVGAAENYYNAYSNRLSNISSLRQAYSGFSGGIMNPYTGALDNSTAASLAQGFANMSAGTGFTEQDMYSMHNMAMQSGMMGGHTGSVSSVLSRVNKLAKTAKYIMDIGEGIDQSTALEMMQLSESMGITLDKFKASEITRKVLTAAKVSNKTLAQTTELMAAHGEATRAAGLGAQQGVESALYFTTQASPQFSQLSGATQAAVGGSKDRFTQNLIQGQTNFATRNAATLALGSYYIDPNTGAFRIDDNELHTMVQRGYDPTEEYKRGMNIVSKDNRKLLRNAGLSSSMVTNLLQQNIGDLQKTAISSIDKDTMTAMQLREITQTALQNNMTPEQAASALGYSKEEFAALNSFAQNYGKGTIASKEAQRIAYLRELDKKGDRSRFISRSQLVEESDDFGAKAAGILEADTAAVRADRARREALGIYTDRPRVYTKADIDSVTLGSNYQNFRNARGQYRFSTGRMGDFQYGAFMGEREVDKSYGFFNDIFGMDSDGFFRNDLADRAISKKVLQKVYTHDFYGDGTDVGAETGGFLGINTGIMDSIVHGEALGVDDLTDSEVRGREGARVIRRALREILGERRGDFDISTKVLLGRLKNREAAEALSGVVTGRGNYTGESVTRMLGAAAAGEIAEFGRIGQRISTESGAQFEISRIADQSKLSEAAYVLISDINANASTTDFFSGKDSSADQLQTATSKIANRLVERGVVDSYEEAEAMVPAVLAKSKQLSPNASVFVNRITRMGMEAGGMLRSGGLDLNRAADIVATTRGIDDYGEGYIDLSGATGYKVSLSELALGVTGSVDTGKIKEVAVGLAGVSNALGKLGVPNPARFLSELVMGFLRWYKKTYRTKNGLEKKEDLIPDIDVAFAQWMRSLAASTYRKPFYRLSTEHQNVVLTYIKSVAQNKDYVRSAQETGKNFSDSKELTYALEGFIGTGHKMIQDEALEGFFEGSSAVEGFFGSGSKKEQVKSALKLFAQLKDEDGIKSLRERYVTSDDVDIDGLMAAFNFTRDRLGESYEEVRGLVSKHFGGGDLSMDSRRAFINDINKKIEAGKVTPGVGGAGKVGSGDMIANAVSDMMSLQSAMALLLKGLATGDSDGELAKSKAILDKIKLNVAVRK